jgi:hypothetical protein
MASRRCASVHVVACMSTSTTYSLRGLSGGSDGLHLLCGENGERLVGLGLLLASMTVELATHALRALAAQRQTVPERDEDKGEQKRLRLRAVTQRLVDAPHAAVADLGNAAVDLRRAQHSKPEIATRKGSAPS